VTASVIVGAARTALGSFQGSLAAVPAPQLGAAAIRGALAGARVEAAEVSDVLMGAVLTAGVGQAPARQAALGAGCPPSTRTLTINKVCGSGLQSILQATQQLAAGFGTLLVAGGMENMSAAPYLLPKARAGFRYGHQQTLDSLLHDGLWDPSQQLPMGACAESCAQRYGLTREQQDAYAAESFRRANAAQADGRTATEITPIVLPSGKGEATALTRDEGPAKVKYDRIASLQPAFQPDGTITAANASSLADGAAAVVVASEQLARDRGLKPLARLVAFGAHAQEPLWFTTAPIPAAQQALHIAGWSVADVDLWEVNEAFAVVPLAFIAALKLDPQRVNVRGGAIALGHPLGASGTRIVVTLLASLRERGLRRGVATACIGGGEALALCVELP
jgi:acetyl-CoA C-acetyltransferase